MAAVWGAGALPAPPRWRAQPQRHPDADGHGKRGPNGAANTTANGQLDDAPLPKWRLIIGIRLTQCHEGRQVQERSRRGSAQVHGSSGGCVGCVLTLYWSREPANVSRAGFGRDAMQILPRPRGAGSRDDIVQVPLTVANTCLRGCPGCSRLGREESTKFAISWF